MPVHKSLCTSNGVDIGGNAATIHLCQEFHDSGGVWRRMTGIFNSGNSLVRFHPLFSRAISHSLCTDRRRMETLISQIAQLLNHTLSPDGNVVGSATEGLDHLSILPDFPFALLAISTEGENQGQRIAAATYLKNFTRRHIDGDRSSKASVDFRNRLVHALLQVEPAVLKILVEAFRIIIVNEFVKENSWPELVPELRSVIQNSNLISGGANCQWNTINALTILQTIIKPFQYFLNPKIKKEPVPPQLELIATEILVPLLAIFHHLVEKALSTQGKTEMEIERILLTVCKCVYFAVRSYMPSALVPLLPSFCRDIFVILGSLNLDGTTWGDSFLLRLRTGKRSLLIFCSLVMRHRKHSDKLMPSIISCVSKIVMQSSNISKLDFLSERIVSLAFDVLSHVLETGPGWRLVSPHFSALLDSAVFPALVMNQKDISEWDEDADEYLRKNLPSDLEEISGWKEDLFTARKSAINLLGVISVAKGPPMLTSSNNSFSASGKRKKGDKSKGRAQQCSMGDLLVLPFLSKIPVPSGASAREINDYYGVLMAYGSLQDFLREQNPVQTATLLQTRVLPVYSLFPCLPYLVANANWVYGELASCLPEEMSADVYASLLKALIMPDMGDISCYPVRASAAGAIAELLENDYLPSDWLPLLQVVVSKIDNEDDNEASILFHLLSSILETASENIAVHIPYIVSTLVGTISKRIPPIPEPWPQVVEGGFAALAVMAQTWEDSVPEDAEIKSSEAWRSGQATIIRAFSVLLQQAWLKPIQHMQEDVAALLPSSCIDNISKLLQFIMKFVTEPNTVSELKLSELLMVWAEVVADWHAWEELEDLSIFETIPEVVNLHQKCDLKNFIVGRLPSPPAPPVPQRSIIEGIAEFVSEAISQYPSATWRACSCVHLLLHNPTFSFEGEGVKQGLVFAFSQAAFSRFKDIQSKPSALWKPLLLAISSCYLCSPDIVERVLEKVVDNGFNIWASALQYISSSSFEPALSSESEIKLIVIALMKVVERLLGMPVEPERGLLQDCFVSLMEAVIRLKEVQEEEENEDDEVEYADENDEAEDIDEDEESEDDEREETEEEFLDRYAEAALNLESTLDVEEGDVEDQDQELELGLFGEVDQQRAVLSLIKRYHHILIKGQTLPPHLVTGLLNAFPDYASFLQHS